MADKKLTALTELATPAAGDFVYAVDVSDTTDGASGTSKKLQVQNMRFWAQTSAESAAGVTPTNYQYEPGNVLRYGTNTTPGTTDMSTAFQNAINGLDSTYGGRVIVPAGNYLVGDIDITYSAFNSGGVLIDMDPRAVITAKSGSTYVFKFAGGSTTNLLQYCGVRGGRIVGTVDDTNYGLWFVNCANWFVEHTSIRQFYSTARSTRAGIYTQYSIFGSIIDPNIQVCDFGMNFENDATNSFRQTTINIFAGNVQTCYRAMRVDDGNQINAYGTSFENSSIGVLYTYTRTTGTNCFSCNLDNCYFEGNGRHVKIEEHGTAITRGINIKGCFFEAVSTEYPGTSPSGAFEDAGSGDYKVDIDGSLHNVSWNYWSTAAAVADIIIQSGATSNYIGAQNRLAADVSLSDSGTSTIDARTPIGSATDHTITGKWRHNDELRLANNVKLRGLNNAGSAWRDLAYITTGDNIIFGNTITNSYVYSNTQPRWFNGSATERMTSSDGTTGGTGSAGAGNQYIELNVAGTTYKVLHDGTV